MSSYYCRLINRLIGVLAVVIVVAATGLRVDAQMTVDIMPPAGATVVTEVQAGGVQVYTCRASAETYVWTLVGPKALLVNDDGTDFGMHDMGPTWMSKDGSAIVADGAHPVLKVDRINGVPALLLTVRSSTGRGVLTPVRLVRRSDTEGGLPPPTGCDAAHIDTTVARHYSAVYTFYK